MLGDAGIGRRAAAGLGIALLVPGTAGAATQRIGFRVHRQGQAIGTHRVVVTAHGHEQAVETHVDVAVRLAGVTVYRFHQHLSEHWRDGRLLRAEGRRERNGKRFTLHGHAEGDRILVRSNHGMHHLPGNAAPLSWWNPALLRRPLFGGDDGRLLDLRVRQEPRPGGGSLFRTTGYEESVAEYDGHGHWIGWTTKAEDGSTVTYERL